MIKGTDYIWEVLEKYPNARKIFEKHGMGCHLCIASNTETIASGAKMHGISLDVLLGDLNEVCK